MQVAWLTDIHMNFVDAAERRRLYADVVASGADVVLIGGDIAEADSFSEELQTLVAATNLPVYFVLGNHDYYRGSIRAVRLEARQISASGSSGLSWLPATGVVEFSDCGTVLVGRGGWGDGRAGDFFRSNVMLNDYLMIEELRDALGETGHLESSLPKSLCDRLNDLGDECAAYFDEVLPQALNQADHVVVLMHVPPFIESCWHEGRISDDNWAPHFVCQAAGVVLKCHMLQHTEKKMTVLCGHTHGAGTTDILPNLHVITGGATYGKPVVQSLLEWR